MKNYEYWERKKICDIGRRLALGSGVVGITLGLCNGYADNAHPISLVLTGVIVIIFLLKCLDHIFDVERSDIFDM